MPRQLVALDCDRGSIRRLGFQAHASTAHARRHAQHTRTSVDRAGLAGWGQSCWRWEWRARRNPQKNRRCYFFGCTARLTTRKYWKPPQPMYIKRSFPPGPPSAKPVPHAGGAGGASCPRRHTSLRSWSSACIHERFPGPVLAAQSGTLLNRMCLDIPTVATSQGAGPILPYCHQEFVHQTGKLTQGPLRLSFLRFSFRMQVNHAQEQRGERGEPCREFRWRLKVEARRRALCHLRALICPPSAKTGFMAACSAEAEIYILGVAASPRTSI